jgi:hypothetical protein
VQLPIDHPSQGSGITVDVALYGPLAKYGGKTHVSEVRLAFESGARMADVLDCLGIPAPERGFTFVNSVLCAMPGLQVDLDLVLKDGDHIGIFSTKHMWPYQYRDGIHMTEALRLALAEQGAMHHAYHRDANP